MDLIPIGDDPPESINVVIEVPVGGEPVKYEFDKKSGALFVDRILHTPMRYPANYGFVPHTLSPDGDPIDALVVARSPADRGALPRRRAWRRRKAADRTGGFDLPLLHRGRDPRGSTRDRSAAGRTFLHPL
jgi:inorganic pyrophosphatase